MKNMKQTSNKSYKVYLQILIIVLLLGWYGFFLTQKIDLTRVDMGRHLKNGQIFIENFGEQFSRAIHGIPCLFNSNFYSYTHPNFPAVNQHWGSGVVFWLVNLLVGFKGLSVFYIALSLLTFWLFFYLAKKNANYKIAVVLSLLLIPLIAQRKEIRPEIFTYFFSALFFWILWRYKQRQISAKWLFVLPALQILWVNLHIYFFLGPFFIGIFLLEELILFWSKHKKEIKKYALVLGLTIAASFLNPLGIKGVFLPFYYILTNYGYTIVENQSVWFLENYGIINSNFLLFKLVFGLLILSFVLLLIKNRRRFSIILFILGISFSTMAWVAFRNLTHFAFFTLPIIAYNLRYVRWPKIKFTPLTATLGAIILSLIIFTGSVLHNYQTLILRWNTMGIGLAPGNNTAAEFFKRENIQGPIFNNYDIGGYLIYYLYPEKRVFVDNRPAEYPADFFQKVYIPMQEKKEIWQRIDKEYNFNAIFFSHSDITPWAQQFLIQRLNDSFWAPVFADRYAMIFLKRNVLNQAIIEQYEIPREYFSITKK